MTKGSYRAVEGKAGKKGNKFIPETKRRVEDAVRELTREKGEAEDLVRRISNRFSSSRNLSACTSRFPSFLSLPRKMDPPYFSFSAPRNFLRFLCVRLHIYLVSNRLCCGVFSPRSLKRSPSFNVRGHVSGRCVCFRRSSRAVQPLQFRNYPRVVPWLVFELSRCSLSGLFVRVPRQLRDSS